MNWYPRKVKRIVVYYDDGTYEETFASEQTQPHTYPGISTPYYPGTSFPSTNPYPWEPTWSKTNIVTGAAQVDPNAMSQTYFDPKFSVTGSTVSWPNSYSTPESISNTAYTGPTANSLGTFGLK